jgi:hypothetical protein
MRQALDFGWACGRLSLGKPTTWIASVDVPNPADADDPMFAEGIVGEAKDGVSLDC